MLLPSEIDISRDAIVTTAPLGHRDREPLSRHPSMKTQAKRSLVSRADPSTSFFLADSSPSISYASGWTAGYAAQADGYDQTLHLTTQSNATVSFNITASSLSLLVPSFPDCTAVISVNSSMPISACATNTSASGIADTPFSLYDLPLGVHEVVWTAGSLDAGQQVVFWGVDATRPAESGMTNVTIDNTYSRSSPQVDLTYSGLWQSLTSALSEQESLSGCLNETLAVSTTIGSSVTFTGAGSAVYLYGDVGPDYGKASLALNGQTIVPSMNLTSPWAMSYELLFFQTGLDATQPNNFTMTNLDGGKMSLDFIVLTTDETTLSHLSTTATRHTFLSTLRGKLVVGLVVPLVAIGLIGLFLFFWLRRRRSSSSSSAPPTSAVPLSIENKRASAYSTSSVPSMDEVFVSYADARSQQLSSRSGGSNPATSPRSPMNRRISPVALPYDLPSSSDGSPTTFHSSGIQSLLGSAYSPQRRGTALPAYTPGENGTFDSTPTPTTDDGADNASRTFLSAAEEKTLKAERERRRSLAQSSITSVFGAPPSERRMSAATAATAHTESHPMPKIELETSPQRLQALATLTANAPPSAFPRSPGEEEDNEGRRGRAMTTSSHMSHGSAARPDSAVIPWDEFVLDAGTSSKGSSPVE
ncbi:hypothetical protein P7C73_g6355, partial [Tremellales sp. Uapishka_1]